jgi:hypothetical protein
MDALIRVLICVLVFVLAFDGDIVVVFPTMLLCNNIEKTVTTPTTTTTTTTTRKLFLLCCYIVTDFVGLCAVLIGQLVVLVLRCCWIFLSTAFRSHRREKRVVTIVINFVANVERRTMVTRSMAAASRDV